MFNMAKVLPCFLVLSSAVCALSFLLDDNSVQSLLTLISDEKKLRLSLEAEILSLRANIAQVKARHDAAMCQCPNKTAIAFSATLTKDINNFGTKQPIIFDRVITNEGGAYDSRYGSFRAPVSGIYKFAFSVLQGTSKMWIGLDLVRDGTPVGRIRTGAYGYRDVGTNIINLHLDAGNDVWVQHMSDSDTKKVLAFNGFYTSFTGHLVKAD